MKTNQIKPAEKKIIDEKHPTRGKPASYSTQRSKRESRYEEILKHPMFEKILMRLTTQYLGASLEDKVKYGLDADYFWPDQVHNIHSFLNFIFSTFFTSQ